MKAFRLAASVFPVIARHCAAALTPLSKRIVSKPTGQEPQPDTDEIVHEGIEHPASAHCQAIIARLVNGGFPQRIYA
jgi:hypothetical protein